MSQTWDRTGLAEVASFAHDRGSTGLLIATPNGVLLDESWPLPADADLPTLAGGRIALRVETLADGRAREDVASVQKSVTSVLVGIAHGRGLIGLDDAVTDHVGAGWTRADADDERRITVRHLLTMTSGLDDRLEVVAEPGSRWDYNLGAGYHTLKRVLTAVSGDDLNTLSQRWLFEPLGMVESEWTRWGPIPAQLEEPRRSMVCYPDGVALEGFTTTARDLARFGLCLLSGGDGLAIDSGYLRESMAPSTPLNPAYGYLWWLNGQPWQLAPKQSDPIDGWLIPDAPADLVAALGDLARAVYIVPSLDLVVVRLGTLRGPAPTGRLQFGRGLWARLRAAGPASDG